MSFERIYTVTDSYDGPLEGIADLGGAPHAYARRFQEDREAFADVFELRPIDRNALELALECWQIWLRWEDAYRSGDARIGSHPALPADRARHEAIAPVLAARLAAFRGPPICARATFRAAPGGGRWSEVEWSVE